MLITVEEAEMFYSARLWFMCWLGNGAVLYRGKGGSLLRGCGCNPVRL